VSAFESFSNELAVSFFLEHISAENQEKCRIGDSSCILRVANEVVARARYGYPELGLPVLDPLRVDKMNVDQGGNGPVSLKISLRNIDLIGLSSTQFRKIEGFKQNIDRFKIELQFLHPAMRIEGPYKLNGKVLILPVQGSGIANISLSEF
jgi:Haemolymph juvenile hormone binding protein (JHBP)